MSVKNETGSSAGGRAGRSVRMRVLMVEDDTRFARSFSEASADHYHIVHAETAEEALDRLRIESFDAVLLDLYLRSGMMDGIEFLDRSLREYPSLLVVLITVEERADAVLAALGKGARGYAPKSLPFEDIIERIDSCLDKVKLEQRATSLEEVLRSEHPWVRFPHPLLDAVDEGVARAASVDSTVLIQGETGTGKSVLARKIHDRSARRDGPFMRFDCGAVAPDLMEAELFGSVAGAFTGARNREGIAEAAHGGTLFIDELDKLNLHMQGRLLSLIENKEVRRVGATQFNRVDIRIVGASSKDLKTLVEKEEFRRELLSRLEVLNIRMPALREIRSVIPELALFYLRHFAASMHRPITGISAEAMELLASSDWPGNVRDLRNAIERAVIYCDGTEVLPHHLPENVLAQGVPRQAGLREAVRAAVERERRRLILEALSRSEWNVAAAAEELKVTPQALRQHMVKLGIGRVGGRSRRG